MMQAYYAFDYQAKTMNKNVFSIYLAGCNFRCPFCNTPELIDFKDDYLEDIKQLKQRIREESNFVEAVLFTGGEPTLQRFALMELARFAKNLGLKVGLDTNGSKPLVIKSLLKKELLDFVNLDIKAPFEEDVFEKTTRSKTFFVPSSQLIQDIKQSIALLEKSRNLEIEVWVLIVPGLLYKKEDVLKIARLIAGLDCRFVLARFSNKSHVLSKKFSNIKAPSEMFLKNLRTAILKKFPNTRVYLQLS